MKTLSTFEHDYHKPFPSFGKPKVIGYIGLENLMYVQCVEEKNVNYDLNVQIDRAKRKPPDLDEKLTQLLKFMLEYEKTLNLPLHNDLKNASFFCYRGLMTCIACTPYEKYESWKIVAILYKGNIYLCQRHTQEKLQKKIWMANTNFTSWGFKFEQYVQSDKPDTQPNPNEPVDETKEFSLVFRTNLNEHEIFYGAEMDGIRCDKTLVDLPPITNDSTEILQYLSTKEFVELKTNRHIEFSRQKVNFKKFKTIRWWCQSFLSGVETILCGFRNDRGIVESLKVYPVRDLPKMCKNIWDPSVCFNFLDVFLRHVKKCLEEEIIRKHRTNGLNNIQSLPLISLCFEWSPYHCVQTTDYCHEDDPILLDWFVERFGKKCM